MEAILLVVTILSIATTIVALTAAGRVRRGERQRSEARVAALAAAAEAHGSERGFGQVSVPRSPIPGPRSPQSPIPQVSPEIAFGTVQRGEATTGRLPLFAAAALITLLGGALIGFRMSAPGTGRSVAAPHTTPLELVSLGHSREARSLTISGIVRNPASGHQLEGLTAVVSLLDSNGGLISTQDVPLDYRALNPGEEAPFKLSVPNPGSITRYRVSFRAGTDLVPHIDRRAETKLAVALR